jgi:hypothetical protein
VPEWHSYDTGQSLIFSSLPLPRSLIQVIIEPSLCVAFGWWLVQRGNATFYLGWWIVISAGLLFFLENTIRIARREGLFDLGDTFVESEHFARRAERFANKEQGSAGTARRQSHADFWSGILWRLRMAAEFAQQVNRKRQNAGEQQRQQEEQRRREEEGARAATRGARQNDRRAGP